MDLLKNLDLPKKGTNVDDICGMTLLAHDNINVLIMIDYTIRIQKLCIFMQNLLKKLPIKNWRSIEVFRIGVFGSS